MSNSQPWDNLKFDLNGLAETQRKFFGTLFNTYNFFALYANIDGFQQDEMNALPVEGRPEIDRWIISRLYSLVAEVTDAYADYEPTKAARAVETFVADELSNWYVRLCRRRFWKTEKGADKQAAFETLYQCLMVVNQLMAPIAPFFSEWMYKNLSDPIREAALANNTPLRHESIHLSHLTKVQEEHIDKALEQRMDYAQRISSLVLSLRKKSKNRVRQPLQRILLPVLDDSFRQQVEGVKDLILSEVNVKEIEYLDDASGFLKKKVKPNFKTLGRRLGKNMKAGAAAINGFTQEDIAALEKSGSYTLNLEGESYDLTMEDFEIVTEDIPGWQVASDGDLTVALDVTITDILKAEGMARELVNRIQNIRKDRDFNITDRIKVILQNHEALAGALAHFKDYICGEVLCDEFVIVDSLPEGELVELVDGVETSVVVEVVS